MRAKKKLRPTSGVEMCNQMMAFADSAIENQSKTADINEFITSVLKDEKGNPIKQAVIHREFHKHIDSAWERGLNAGILAPWGHAKTEQLAIGRTLWMIGQHPELRGKLICANDDIATQRVASIKEYLDSSDEFHKLFPHVEVDRKRGDQKRMFFVKRKSMSKDATLTAGGILSTAIGARDDYKVFDDVVDLRNSVQMPALRPQVKAAFYNTWMSRGEADTKIVYVATVWMEDDLSMELLTNEMWSFMVISVADSMDHLEVRYTNAA